MSTRPRTVGEVMTRAVVSAHDGAVFKEIAAVMARNHVSTVPVLDDDRHVIGVVSAADLLVRTSHDRGRPPQGHRLRSAVETRHKVHADTARSLMTAPAVTVTEDVTTTAAATIAADHRVRCMPVVDGDGVLVGILSKSDLLKVYLRDDDELCAQLSHDVAERLAVADPSDAVSVTVREGVVSLHGCVERRLVADQLVNAALAVPGVVDVDVRPSYRLDDVVTANVWPPY